MSVDDAIGGAGEVSDRIAALEARVADLERRLAGSTANQPYGAADAGTADAVDPWSVPPWPEIVQLLHQRKKIQAIKVYREVFRVGLQEAKDIVEEAERRLGLA